MKRVLGLILAGMMSLGSTAADTDGGYVIDSFWTNWYLGAGLDMSLQNPYGHGKPLQKVDYDMGKYDWYKIARQVDDVYHSF